MFCFASNCSTTRHQQTKSVPHPKDIIVGVDKHLKTWSEGTSPLPTSSWSEAALF
jgi:SRSO17 transposase